MPPKLPELVKRARRLATERDRLVQELARECEPTAQSERNADRSDGGLTTTCAFPSITANVTSTRRR